MSTDANPLPQDDLGFKPLKPARARLGSQATEDESDDLGFKPLAPPHVPGMGATGPTMGKPTGLGAQATGLSAQPPETLWGRVKRAFTEGIPRYSTRTIESPKYGQQQIVSPEELMTPAEQQHHPIATGLGEFAGGLTSPENVALMAGTGGFGELPGAAGKILPRLVSAGFSAQMLRSAYQQAPELKAAIDRGDYPEAERLATILGLTAATAGFAGGHAVIGTPVMGRTKETMPTTEPEAQPSRGMLPQERSSPTAIWLREHPAEYPSAGERPIYGEKLSLEQLGVRQPVESEQELGFKPAEKALPAAQPVTAHPEEVKPAEGHLAQAKPEARPLEKAEAGGYQRQQAQSYVNLIRNPLKRGYAQDYLRARLEGGPEPDRGGLSVMSAQAVRQNIEDKLGAQKPAAPAEKYSADILGQAHHELRAASDLWQELPAAGRYERVSGEPGTVEERGAGWYGIKSSKPIVAGQFPWLTDLDITPGKLRDAVERGKGAEFNRLLSHVADHIQSQQEEAGGLEAAFAELDRLAAEERSQESAKPAEPESEGVLPGMAPALRVSDFSLEVSGGPEHFTPPSPPAAELRANLHRGLLSASRDRGSLGSCGNFSR